MLPLRRHNDPAIQTEVNNLCRWITDLLARADAANQLIAGYQADLAELEDVAELVTSATAPDDPPEGKHWLDTSVTPAELKVYADGAWIVIGPEESGGGGLEIIGAIDRDVTLAEDLLAGDIVQVRGEANITSLESWVSVTASDAASYDRFGSGVAYNATGTIMAVGAKDWEGSGMPGGIGCVYIYDMIDGNWVQRGSPIPPPVGFRGGESVALSADGNILAFSALGYSEDKGGVWIFDYAGGSWASRGRLDIDPGTSVTKAVSVALSADGNRLAVGLYRLVAQTGRVLVFDYADSAWTNTATILGGSYEEIGHAVALSASGNILAVSGRKDIGVDDTHGEIYIYDCVDGAWIRRGGALRGADTAASDWFGSGVALSADGEFMAVGAEQWEGSLTNQGGVYIFDRNGTGWTQRGSFLVAPDPAGGNRFGHSVAITADSSQLAIGAHYRGVTSGGFMPEAGVVYVADVVVNHTLKAYKSVSPTSPIPSDLYYVGIMNEAGSTDEVKSAKMVFWISDPLGTLEP